MLICFTVGAVVDVTVADAVGARVGNGHAAKNFPTVAYLAVAVMHNRPFN